MSTPQPDPSNHALETHDCPARPSSLERSELGFVRRPMVSWLNPRQLVDTAIRAMLSGIFGGPTRLTGESGFGFEAVEDGSAS